VKRHSGIRQQLDKDTHDIRRLGNVPIPPTQHYNLGRGAGLVTNGDQIISKTLDDWIGFGCLYWCSVLCDENGLLCLYDDSAIGLRKVSGMIPNSK